MANITTIHLCGLYLRSEGKCTQFPNVTKKYMNICLTLCKGQDSELCNNIVYGKT